ncbi:hypothetical protein SDC9_201805 [bioreactor metagenome]|uniref:2-isopropylmalate synthase LeuA allosteric (dimerisation) domain-containing protein n=1 Tax=bioreactor metagenome TaxID=1076179 RepID=A0A645ISP0_9ZZZZ
MENLQGIAHNRLVFEELSLTKRKDTAVARVALAYNGATRFAEGETGHYSDEISRMVCELTLQAVEAFFPDEMRFTLMDFKLHDLAGEQVVTVCVGLRRGGILERYVGCALASEDQNLAVVRAVLNALNRRLSIELK